MSLLSEHKEGEGLDPACHHTDNKGKKSGETVEEFVRMQRKQEVEEDLYLCRGDEGNDILWSGLTWHVEVLR